MLCCPCYRPESRIIGLVNKRVCNHGSWMHATFSVCPRRRKVRSSRKRHGLSTNLMIARQENAKGISSHLPILVKLFAPWWQMLVQALDITVWFGGEGDLESERLQLRALQTSGLRLLVSQLRCRSKLFETLPASLLRWWRTRPRHTPFNYSRSTRLPILMLQTPSRGRLLSSCQTNVRLVKTNVCDCFKRTFTEFSARFVSAFYFSHRD